MKKRSLILIVVLTVILLFAMSSAVSAEPNGAISCELDISYNGAYWLGTVSGPEDECSVAGVIRFDAVPSEYDCPGKTMHFVETFGIWPGLELDRDNPPDPTGAPIQGKNYGVWNMKDFKYRAQGWVEVATDGWDHLEGSQYHEMGTTTDPFNDPNPDDNLIIYAPGGWMKLVPGNRQGRPERVPQHADQCP